MPDQTEQTPPHNMIHVSEWLARMTDAPMGWALDGVVPLTGTVLVEGGTYAGKTQFLATLSVAVAAGVPFAGRATAQGPVGWFYLEHQDQDLRGHLVRAAAGFGVDLATLPIYILDRSNAWEASDAAHVESGRRMMDAIKPALVVVDCARAASPLNENEAHTAGLVAGVACRALNGNGIRVCALVHHLTKRSKEGAGSGYWHGAADHVLKLTAARDRKAVTMALSMHGPTPSPVTLSVELSDATCVYSPGKPPKAKEPKESTVSATPNPNLTPTGTPEDILHAIIGGTTPVPERKIRTRLTDAKVKMGGEFVTKTLKTMAASGSLTKTEAGYAWSAAVRLVPDAVPEGQ